VFRTSYHSLCIAGLLLIPMLFHCKPKQVVQAPAPPTSFRTFPDEIKVAVQQDSATTAVQAEYFDRKYVRNIDHVYREQIHTLQLYPLNAPLSPPLLHLGSAEQLLLNFDVFSEERFSFNYKIVHCNANWQPSELIPQEYIDGFTNDEINAVSSSENTLQQYTHYRHVFPNDYFKLVRSGNYLIHLYDGEELVLTKRFMVTESKVTITPTLKRATLIEDQNYKQELDLKILHGTYAITDPYQSLVVVLQQNRRWDNAVIGLKPNFVKNNELIFDHDEENVFEGGNEFRSIDLKNLRFQAGTIDRIQVEKDGLYHAYLQDDEARSYKQYFTASDLNGRMLIKKDGTENVDIESDYIFVHFSLPYNLPETTGDIYIFGQLSDWQLNDRFKMKYDATEKRYTKTLFLKQGYYEYNYAFLEDQKRGAEFMMVEGTHFETENDYNILVYYRQAGENYDRLIAVKNLNSVKKN
jgi:hypothetical protein